MKTKQPNWQYVGHFGVDPIAYGGGFVYQDVTEVYPPEVTYFEPASDEQWHKLEEKTPVTIYRFILEQDSESKWWYKRLSDIALYTGRPLEEIQLDAHSTNPLTLAQLYSDLISYFGAEEFDSYPITMTEEEAYEKYAGELKLSR